MGKRKALLPKGGLNGLLYMKTCIESGLSMLNGRGFERHEERFTSDGKNGQMMIE